MPAEPPGPREVHDEVEPVELDVEELPVPPGTRDEASGERGQRRVEGLERGHAREVDPGDGARERVRAQVLGEGLHLGQLGHGSFLRYWGCSGLLARAGVPRFCRVRTACLNSALASARPRM